MTEELAKIVYLVPDSDILRGPPSPPDDGDGDDGSRPVFCSDDALADELTKKLGEDWICLHPSAVWYRWTGQVWRQDHKKRVVEIAR